MDAYYHRNDAGGFDATEATTSPWDDRAQHAGPPLALIARAVDDAHGSQMAIGRITLEIMGPIPKPGLAIATKVLRPGKRIELIEARLRAGDKDVIVANVWRFGRLPEGSAPVPASPAALAPEIPGPDRVFAPMGNRNGYFKSFEWRAASGSFDLGPASVWCRTELPLIAGERKEPRDALLALADSANGISTEVPFTTWLSIPSSVTLTLARDPVGEWMNLDASTLIGPDGRGVTTGNLADERGPVGNIVQALLVAPR